jgi:hypothetical protein
MICLTNDHNTIFLQEVQSIGYLESLPMVTDACQVQKTIESPESWWAHGTYPASIPRMYGFESPCIRGCTAFLAQIYEISHRMGVKLGTTTKQAMLRRG